MGAATSAVEMMETIPDSKSDLKSFLDGFVFLAEPGEKGKALRKKEWSSIDQNGSGVVSLTECQNWIRQTLCAKPYENKNNEGSRLWKFYKRSFILAFHDAADGDGGGLDSYVTPKEFRLLVAYICFYAAMFDWFALIDGGDEGIKKEDDTRISLEEWKAWFTTKKGIDDYKFAVMENFRNETLDAEEFFKEIDFDGHGKVLLKEWCKNIKKHEIDTQTLAGKWLDAGDRRKTTTRRIIMRAASFESRHKAKCSKDSLKAKEHLKILVDSFAPLAVQGEDGKNLRKKEWSCLDQNGNGKVSLAECWRWIRNKLITELKDKDKGTDLWKMYRPSYILAFSDAASVQDDDDKEFVTPREFRLLAAYVCFYATMYDWFAAVDGGDVGVTKNDDRRISLEEWENWFADKEGVEERRFALADLIKNDTMDAKEFFLEMDADKGGMVLLKEWCQYIKKIEIENGTDIGKWIDYKGLI